MASSNRPCFIKQTPKLQILLLSTSKAMAFLRKTKEAKGQQWRKNKIIKRRQKINLSTCRRIQQNCNWLAACMPNQGYPAEDIPDKHRKWMSYAGYSCVCIYIRKKKVNEKKKESKRISMLRNTESETKMRKFYQKPRSFLFHGNLEFPSLRPCSFGAFSIKSLSILEELKLLNKECDLIF